MLASGATSRVFFSPSGVISNAQAKTSTNGNPRINKNVMVGTTHAGAANVGSTVVTIWIRSHAATAYVMPTLTTLRRLSSAKNDPATSQPPPAPLGFYLRARTAHVVSRPPGSKHVDRIV